MIENAIKDFSETLQVQKLGERQRVKGKFRETFDPLEDFKATAIPGGMNDVVIDSDGASIQIDYKFYVVGSQSIPDRSLITYKGVIYEVRGFIDRNPHGDFTIYKGVKRR